MWMSPRMRRLSTTGAAASRCSVHGPFTDNHDAHWERLIAEDHDHVVCNHRWYSSDAAAMAGSAGRPSVAALADGRPHLGGHVVGRDHPAGLARAHPGHPRDAGGLRAHLDAVLMQA